MRKETIRKLYKYVTQHIHLSTHKIIQADLVYSGICPCVLTTVSVLPHAKIDHMMGMNAFTVRITLKSSKRGSDPGELGAFFFDGL